MAYLGQGEAINTAVRQEKRSGEVERGGGHGIS